MGTPESCMRLIDQLKTIGVDEVACLIDFGVDYDSVMLSLQQLNLLKERANTSRESGAGSQNYSITAQITRHKVTHLQCTPSLASMLAMDPEAFKALGSLEKLMVGGEAFPLSLAKKLSGVLPGKILNMYGPTETTIWSTTYALNGFCNSIPIGRPIANTEVYILDQFLQPVPIGVTGELFIGGDGVTPGYLNRPELTAEKFVPNPFSSGDRRVLYRTGDLARYMPDRNIEFLGRIDFQVKIRGFRIELGEIETMLGTHPTIKENVVIVREDIADDKQLVAYIVPNHGQAPNPEELRNFLRDKLPEKLVPSWFVVLDGLSLTPNGKVDRKALSAPDRERPDLEHSSTEPQSPMELLIAEAWKEVLGLDSISLNDNFFDLGGHSLLAMKVIVKLQKITGLRIIPRELLFQTLGQLALSCDERVLRVPTAKSRSLPHKLFNAVKRPFTHTPESRL